MRILGFSRYLCHHGWTPRVLSTTPDSAYPPQGEDPGLSALLPESLDVDRVPHANPLQRLIRLRDQLRHFARPQQEYLHSNDELRKQSGTGQTGRISTLKHFILDWAFSFPDPQCFWFRPAVSCLSRLHKKEFPDVVFTTYPPGSGLLVGRTLAHRFRVPFVADLRDPWVGIGRLDHISSSSLVARVRRLERLVFADAARVIMNTEELRLKYSAIYPEHACKFVTIPNGFDGEVIHSAINSAHGPHDPWLELSHFGTVYGRRSPFPLFKALSELLEENQVGKDRLRLRFVGKWDVLDHDCEAIACHLEKQGILKREPPLPRDICLRQMAQAQALLVLQPSYPLQIPAKLYEYIGSGRPVVVIGGEGATANVVQRHGLGVCCPNQVSAIKTLLRRLATTEIRLERPSTTNKAPFDYRNLTGELAKVLDDVCLEDARLG